MNIAHLLARSFCLTTCLVASTAAVAAVMASTQPRPQVVPTPVDATAIAMAELPAGVKRSPALDGIIADLRASRLERANTSWERVVTELRGKGTVDTNALIQWVLRESYLQTTEDLRLQADKVKYFNDLKKSMREYIATLRRTSEAGGDWPRPVRAVTFRTTYVAGQSPIQQAATRTVTKADLDRSISAIEAQLKSVGDDAQLANVDLQNILHKQQQTLQTISNVSKMLHDTATAVIRKIGN